MHARCAPDQRAIVDERPPPAPGEQNLGSRADGIPMGPHAGVLEKTSPIDLACTVAEVVTIVLRLGIIGRQRRRWVLDLLLVAGIAIWALRLTNTWI